MAACNNIYCLSTAIKKKQIFMCLELQFATNFLLSYTDFIHFCASAVESLACLGQFFVQVLDRAKSNQRLAQAVARC